MSAGFCSLWVVSISICRSATATTSNQLLGIAPLDVKCYKSSEMIKCKNRFDEFARDQLNNDFCDCPDGTNEPGTSACPTGVGTNLRTHRVMIFANGDKCWNEPDRSLKVRLKCGLKNEVDDERSRCEYVALLSTPGLCLEGKLQLEGMAEEHKA